MQYREFEVMPLEPEDEEAGCFLFLKVNGVQLKLVKCKSNCEAIHCYAVDLEMFDFQFDYIYETGDTKATMIQKVTQKLVDLQAHVYLQQKAYIKQAGQYVNH